VGKGKFRGVFGKWRALELRWRREAESSRIVSSYD